MKLYFIEEPLEYYMGELLDKVDLIEEGHYFYIYREDSYFANIDIYNKFKDEKDIVIITDDDRILSQYEVDKNNDLLFYNFNTEQFDSYRKFYPNIRKANNIESMWRRRIFPRNYYLMYHFDPISIGGKYEK